MLLHNWPSAFAHVDCDAFYASCERARRPELRAVPVCVLSNQSAFVIAKTYDAKKLGITTGMSVRDAKKLAPRAVYLTPDFAYYGQMSDQVFSVLRRYSPEIEVYSIDEGFIGMHGLRTLWRKSYAGIADELRAAVRGEVGITISVGIAVTKTLAKMASESRKPDGTTIVPGKAIEAFLAAIPAGDIPGIGGKRCALLGQFKIHTALDFASTPQFRIQRLMGKLGLDLWHELRGVSVFPLELEPKLPKSVARTAAMGEHTNDRTLIGAHLARHVSRLAIELVTKRYLTRRVLYTLRLSKTFDTEGTEVRFRFPTSNYFVMVEAAHQALDVLYRPGVSYWGCGVVASDISSAVSVTPDLFGLMQHEDQRGRLMLTVDEINRKYGKGTAIMLSSVPLRNTRRASRFRYPMLEVD